MTKSEAAKNAEILIAYSEGKTIQRKITGKGWVNTLDPSFNFDEYNYRIKPGERQVPYTFEAFWEAMSHHKPAVRFKSLSSDQIFMITVADNTGVICGVNSSPLSYQYMFTNYVWADTLEPFGQTVTE